MSKTTERFAFWDDELETLTSSVAELFGEDIVVEAVERTFHQYRRGARRDVTFEGLKAALKAELRRMTRPQ